MAKARKTGFTLYGTYSNIVEYEYRGKTYEVEYAKGFNYCCTPAHVQHKDAQAKIDNVLDNPKTTAGKPVNMNEIFEMLDWFIEEGEQS